MEEVSGVLSILSAMITPAVLILATGSLILTTSQRLGRCLERARKLTDLFEALFKEQVDPELLKQKKVIFINLMNKATRRAKLLQHAMVALYLALNIFILTSVLIGIFEILNLGLIYIPLYLALGGAGLLLYAAGLLMAEAKVALGAIYAEVGFMRSLGNHYMPGTAPAAGWFKRMF